MEYIAIGTLIVGVLTGLLAALYDDTGRFVVAFLLGFIMGVVGALTLVAVTLAFIFLVAGVTQIVSEI